MAFLGALEVNQAAVAQHAPRVRALAAATQATPPGVGAGCQVDRTGIPARDWLDSASSAIGMSGSGGRVLHYHPSIALERSDQADRPYPPFPLDVVEQERWFDAQTDVERVPLGPSVAWKTATAVFRGSDSAQLPAPEINTALEVTRDFNPWAIVADWRRDSTVRVRGRCPYLDFERVALVRRGPLGEEWLLIDPRSYFPMALRTLQLHYFLGPVHDEYRYTTWFDIGPHAYYPITTMKLTDGLGTETWTVTPDRASLVPRDSAPRMGVPDTAIVMPPEFSPRFGDDIPDTVRVGLATFLLVNRAFTSVVALARDTVFLADAAGGEERARRDSIWVGRLFPGRHAVTLVLLNADWPHIAGLRFWIASGASVVGHPLIRAVVNSAMRRPWIEHPDKLASLRRRPQLRFREVRDSMILGNGALTLYEIGGAASEGMLMAYFPEDRFIWASDRITFVVKPSLYVSELVRAVERHKLDPALTSGPHVRLLPWARISGLASR